MNSLTFEPAPKGTRLPEHAAELLTALDQLFLSVVKLELDTGRAWLLQSRGQKDRQPYAFDWEEYIRFYQTFLDPDEAEKLTSSFSLSHLNQLWAEGSPQHLISLFCRPETALDWLEVMIRFSTDKKLPVAYIITRQRGDNYLLRRIIDLYVYNSCDCFYYLDANHNSCTMFSGKEDTPLPPPVCIDYSAEMVKYTKKFVVPEDQEMVIYEMSLERVLSVLEHQESHALTCGMRDKNGAYTRKRVEFRYYNRARRMILLTRTDITQLYEEQQRQTQELESALLRAQTDPLTGLWSYQGIQEVVKQGLEHLTKKAAIFFLDLDDFKLINDTYGHAEGDRALRTVADILRRNIRAEDHAARVGGDEFVVFLSSIPSAEAAKDCARRICGQLAEIQLEPTGARISGSIGIAIAPEEGADYETLVKKADSKAYRAKSNGKNQFAI
ncbi:MAG: GGDEF domain-containing protein [Clostridiales bacterium]|nr:GGDEF domain-containing protein [Clostridiales bacterium]